MKLARLFPFYFFQTFKLVSGQDDLCKRQFLWPHPTISTLSKLGRLPSSAGPGYFCIELPEPKRRSCPTEAGLRAIVPARQASPSNECRRQPSCSGSFDPRRMNALTEYTAFVPLLSPTNSPHAAPSTMRAIMVLFGSCACHSYETPGESQRWAAKAFILAEPKIHALTRR